MQEQLNKEVSMADTLTRIKNSNRDEMEVVVEFSTGTYDEERIRQEMKSILVEALEKHIQKSS